MGQRKYLDGDSAVAFGVMVSRAEVIPAYPITPQTKIIEKIAELIADGQYDAEYVKVESEHAAMSACLGISTAGVRAFTATSSQGLAYMQEMLHYISGARLPVVMVNVNRSFAPPWNIWVDHQDSISARDTGWVQIYVESSQEALDSIIQAYKIAEDRKVLTPVMVCLDAFILSHTDEVVEIPDQEKVDGFLPPFTPENFLDVKNPKSFSAGGLPEFAMEFRHEQQKAIMRALPVIKAVDQDFGSVFGRSYGGLIDAYKCDGADAVLAVLGSVAGTGREVVDEMRGQGCKVGLVRVRAFRPFPVEEFRSLAKGVKSIGVLDRDVSFGYEGALYTEVKSALYGVEKRPFMANYIAGLGGRDISRDHIRQMFTVLLEDRPESRDGGVRFIGSRCEE